MKSRTRREFLAVMGTAAAIPPALASAEALISDRSFASNPWKSSSEYQFAPGLTYLNTASLGPTSRDVLDRTLKAWQQLELNPVRMSYGDGAVHAAADQVRATAATFLGCNSDNLLITRNTTDAMNNVALGMRLTRGDHVLTTDQEHHGGSNCWRYLERRQGVIVDIVPIAHSDHDPKAIVDRFAAALTPNTRVISVSHVLTSTGLRMPIIELATLARDRGVLCVVDGAQAVGQIPVNVTALRCHAYAASGHKWLLGPKGTGLLYVSPDAKDAIVPIQWGDGKRFVEGSSGMGSLPLAVGLGAAIEKAHAYGLAAIERRVLELREYTLDRLKQVPKVRVISTFPSSIASGLVAMTLPAEIKAPLLLKTLNEKHNVVVKMVEKHWFNGIRISPHIFNTEADIDRAVKALRTELG